MWLNVCDDTVKLGSGGWQAFIVWWHYDDSVKFINCIQAMCEYEPQSNPSYSVVVTNIMYVLCILLCLNLLVITKFSLTNDIVTSVNVWHPMCWGYWHWLRLCNCMYYGVWLGGSLTLGWPVCYLNVSDDDIWAIHVAGLGSGWKTVYKWTCTGGKVLLLLLCGERKALIVKHGM